MSKADRIVRCVAYVLAHTAFLAATLSCDGFAVDTVRGTPSVDRVNTPTVGPHVDPAATPLLSLARLPYLDVPFISQIETIPIDNVSRTTGWANCGPASIAMVADYCGQRPPLLFDDSAYVRLIREEISGAAFTQTQGNISETDIKHWLESHQLSFTRADSLEEALQATAAGHPCIVAVMGDLLVPAQTPIEWFAKNPKHILVLKGHGALEGRRVVYVNDPLCYWEDQRLACTARDHPGYYDYDDFERAMIAHGMEPFVITASSCGAVTLDPVLAPEPTSPHYLPDTPPRVTPPAPGATPVRPPTPSPLPAHGADRIAYIAVDGSIWTIKPDGSDVRQLTPPDEGAFGLAWSPDGQRISYTSYREGNHEIYVLNADGSNLRNLTNSVADEFWPVWSPDGRRIAYTHWQLDGDYEIYVMDEDGGNKRNVTNNAADDEMPAWSPDGTRIAYQSTRSGRVAYMDEWLPNGDIYVMNADGTDVIRLTDADTGDRWPAWSPDGLHIAYLAQVDLGWEGDNVVVIDADGSGPARAVVEGAPCFDWSPNGERIAYISYDRDIAVLNTDEGSRSWLTSGAMDGCPTWSPDGEQIAFESGRARGNMYDGERDLYVMNADGSNLKRLTTIAPVIDFAWSP